MNTSLHNVIDKYLVDPQVKNDYSQRKGPRDFEERRTGVLNNTYQTTFIQVMAAQIPRRASLTRSRREHHGGLGEDSSSDVEETDVDIEVGKAKRIAVEEAAEVLRGEKRGRGEEPVLYKLSTSSSVPHPRPHPHPRPYSCPP
jgi:hypothetical protein